MKNENKSLQKIRIIITINLALTISGFTANAVSESTTGGLQSIANTTAEILTTSLVISASSSIIYFCLTAVRSALSKAPPAPQR